MKIYLFASSEIVLPPMEIATFLKIALLHYFEIVLSQLEIEILLKINVFAISEIVLPPMEIATFSKIALLNYSEIVLSPMEIRMLFKSL